MDYKATINLPRTDFPMKANLAQREPLFLERWNQKNIYRAILEKNAGRPRFILHDGPPYANGNIHLGHVMNKTLKDMVVKSKTMAGYQSPYVPGWDCHGLPIEHQVLKNLKGKAKDLPPIDLRQECRKYAEQFINIQREEFKRLGIFGDWDECYKTMDFPYQAKIAREFAKVVEKGFVYRSRRVVHWCIYCQTALAEAEIEYANHRSPSVYVSYPLVTGPKEPNTFAVIWTTTPWTLPASMAIAYSESEEYVVVEKKGDPARYIIAKALFPQVGQAVGGEESLRIVSEIGPGTKLKGFKAKHPFLDRDIPLLPAGHVTMEAGTGLVHTAPGHGEEDYDLGRKNGIEIYSPVGADGKFEASVEHFAGLRVFDANPKIIDHLKKVGRLFAPMKEIDHSYPHCWRCKNPVIFRATEQWFLSLAEHDLRKKTLEEIDRLQWVPSWGRDRIYGMISARPDWCLSRQRFWGVPLIAFFCGQCNEPLLSAPVIRHVADQFEKESADAWFRHPASHLLPSGTKCAKCGSTNFEKGKDILDVWFDSGVSHAAVLESREGLSWPCDVYLEGSDQHRGWFHSSLLEGMATRGRSPFKSVITHGFVVDGEGKKLSKSAGNYISAQDMVKQNGAEMLRFWVATEDYRDDVRLSKEIMDRIVESYRRIRNTARYCLGNLSDFSPDSDRVPAGKWPREIDRWAADRLSRLVHKVREAYETYEFHLVVQSLNEFCVVDLSSLYLDVAKDCLYCDETSGPRRRSAQTILYETVSAIARMIAPILPFTSEEIWDAIPASRGKAASVHLSDFPDPVSSPNDELAMRWQGLLAIRGEVSKALERLRKDKKIGQSLEAHVQVKAPEPYRALIEKYKNDLGHLWIVSRATIVDEIDSRFERFESEEIKGLVVGAIRIEGNKCERCWMYTTDIGSVSKHPTLCRRCADVVK